MEGRDVEKRLRRTIRAGLSADGLRSSWPRRSEGIDAVLEPGTETISEATEGCGGTRRFCRGE